MADVRQRASAKELLVTLAEHAITMATAAPA